jgi:hypothetical protein
MATGPEYDPICAISEASCETTGLRQFHLLFCQCSVTHVCGRERDGAHVRPLRLVERHVNLIRTDYVRRRPLNLSRLMNH